MILLSDELRRYISLFLDRPDYFYLLNKEFNRLNYSYIWLLPQYFKSHLIGNVGDTQELSELKIWYREETPTKTIYKIVKDLSSILESVYNTSHQKLITPHRLPVYNSKKRVNYDPLKLIIKDNITSFHLNNNVDSFRNCRVHRVYRLPSIIMYYIKKYDMLQVKALIY